MNPLTRIARLRNMQVAVYLQLIVGAEQVRQYAIDVASLQQALQRW